MATKFETVNNYLIKKYKENACAMTTTSTTSTLAKAKTKTNLTTKTKTTKATGNANTTYQGVDPNGFVTTEGDTELQWEMLVSWRHHARKYNQRTFHIADVTPLSQDIVPNCSFGIRPVKYKPDTILAEDRLGVFKITFEETVKNKLTNQDKTTQYYMYLAKWRTGGGNNASIEGIAATETKTWYKYKRMLNKHRRHNAKPKPGTYVLRELGQGMVYYDPVEKPNKIPTVHPTIKTLDKDLDFFFNNVSLYTRYGMPGTRKVALIGPPGTGKTSMAYRVAREHSDKKSVVFCTEISLLATHLASCAKYGVPTIAILEDAESAFNAQSPTGGASSSVLNFLDGINQKPNKSGAYVIFTTNFPEAIEPRIIQRPGRIDKLLEVGTLKGSDAVECARIYFEPAFKITKTRAKKLEPIVDNMSGAQIKELAQSTFSYTVSTRAKKITTDLVQDVKDGMKEDLKEVYKYADDTDMFYQKLMKKIGFDSMKEKYGITTKKLPF
ncbi:MAG: ATP-binding protein [Candidatus Jacksonbacteria bacterium]|mgnify:FL=1|jgi:hypothetical protein|nr:ATP-binding protein [Candidatus Jacksonbacteria bacterium]